MTIEKPPSVFRRLREEDEPFLDNSAAIPSVIRYGFTEAGSILAPHGFGKSAFLSMAAEFYDYRKDSRALFEGLEIAKDEAFCTEHMNKHPVIFLRLGDFVFSTREEGIAKWVGIMAEAILQFPEVLEGDVGFSQVAEPLSDFVKNRPTDPRAFSEVLGDLVEAITLRWGEPILLVDDYDVPALSAERIGLGRDFTDIWVKCLESAVHTFYGSGTKNGILVSGVKPAFINSAWPRDRTFERMIGFRMVQGRPPVISLFDEPHVKALLDEAGAADRFDELVALCGGLGVRRLVHPASVMEFLRALKTDPAARPEPMTFDEGVIFDAVLRGSEERTVKILDDILEGKDVVIYGRIPLTMEQAEMNANTAYVVMIHYGLLNLKPGKGLWSRHFGVEVPNASARAALERLKERLVRTGPREPVPHRQTFHFV